MRPDIRIVWRRLDGGVSITFPLEHLRGTYSVGTESVTTEDLIAAGGEKLLNAVDSAVADGVAEFQPTETEDQFADRIAEKLIADGVASGWERVAVLPATEVPASREFRDAWVVEGEGVVVCIHRAREMTRDRLRREREFLLKTLDIEFMRAVEADADSSAIVAEKQRLRDITKLVDQCGTLDELRALTCAKR